MLTLLPEQMKKGAGMSKIKARPKSLEETEHIVMKHVSIGGLDVSRIGLGTMSMSGYYNIGEGSDAESIRAIHRALDLGVTHLDTAEIYGPTTMRSSSAGQSRATATRWCWRRSSASSRTPAARASSTAARRTSASRSGLRKAARH